MRTPFYAQVPITLPDSDWANRPASPQEARRCGRARGVEMRLPRDCGTRGRRVDPGGFRGGGCAPLFTPSQSELAHFLAANLPAPPSLPEPTLRVPTTSPAFPAAVGELGDATGPASSSGPGRVRADVMLRADRCGIAPSTPRGRS